MERATQRGTVAGYLRHIWAVTEPCDYCRISWHLFADRPPPKNARKQFDQEWINS